MSNSTVTQTISTLLGLSTTNGTLLLSGAGLATVILTWVGRLALKRLHRLKHIKRYHTPGVSSPCPQGAECEAHDSVFDDAAEVIEDMVDGDSDSEGKKKCALNSSCCTSVHIVNTPPAQPKVPQVPQAPPKNIFFSKAIKTMLDLRKHK